METAERPPEVLRNATLADLADLLRDQQARKLDMVVPAAKMCAVDGELVIGDTGELVPHPIHGLVAGGGTFAVTAVCEEGIAEKLKVPGAYLRRCREEGRLDIWDANVNGWLAGDDRSFLLRSFIGNDERGIARALLSNGYRAIDHIDTMGAVLDGARQAKAHIEVEGCDLSERRMYLRLTAPEVSVYAPRLLGNYRSPYSGLSGSDLPVISAGIVATNSETGGGAAAVTPRMVVQVCTNGMTRTVDAVRAVHLGGRLEQGVVTWTADTQQKALELITAKARDAVATFLNVDYMNTVIDEMTEKAGVKLRKPAAVLEMVAKKLSYSQETLDGILDHFIKGSDTTAGGVFHAVTSWAQQVVDPDAAHELEASAWKALDLVAVGR